MTLYLCLDDRNGMRFNKRRQSRDAAVLEDIRASLPDVLTIDPFSEKLIQEAQIPYVLAGEVLSSDAHFFAENREAAQLMPLAKKIVIYRWNRHYPADTWWDAELTGFILESTREFSGRSHDTITKEVYVK